MKMKNKLLIIAIFTLAFTACFSPWKGEEGVLTITLGGRGASRSAVKWPPYYDDGGVYFRYPMSFLVILDGPTGIKEERFNFNEGDSCTDIKFSFSVAPGLWNIYVENRIHNNFLYASDSNTVYVNAGQTNSVGLSLKKKYYEIGDTGPGGGIIFYVEPMGFILYDIEKANNKTCYYLEAASSDAEDAIGWCDGDFKYDVLQDDNVGSIGYGRKNTQIIVNAHEGIGFAAQLCTDVVYGGFDDWFLPSFLELLKMYENLYSRSGFSFGVKYWSSSFTIIEPESEPERKIRVINFENGNEENDLNAVSDTACVRAIRAF
jgi:hypothetical protein